MKLTITQLEKTTLHDVKLKGIIDIFLAAINDWPNPISNLEDYEYEIEKFIKAETQKSNIKRTLDIIDLTQNAWEAESLAQIVAVFDFYDKELSLEDIINDLKEKLKHD